MHRDVIHVTLTLLLGLLLSGVAIAGDTNESIVTIASPQNGDMVGSPVDLKYELKKGTHGNHVHVYVDGHYPERL